MFEYLIEDYSDYDQPGNNVPVRRVGIGELVKELMRALEDDTVCIAVYEIRECIIDWTARDKKGE